MFGKHGGIIRIILYLIVSTFSMVLFALSIVRIYSTQHPSGGPYDHGKPLIEPEMIVLLVASALGVAFTQLILRQLWYRDERPHHRRGSRDLLATMFAEILGLSSLWALWLGGSIAATIKFRNISSCSTNGRCTIIEVILAVAWIGTVVETVLFVPSWFMVATTGAWGEPHYDVWGHRTLGTDLKDRDEWGRRGQLTRRQEEEDRTRLDEETVVERPRKN